MPEARVTINLKNVKDQAKGFVERGMDPLPPKEVAKVRHMPPEEHRWRPGTKGNTNLHGMSNMDAAQARINAKTALRIRAHMLEVLESKVATKAILAADPEATPEEREEAENAVLKYLSSEVNTMLRDAEHRGLGAPKQEVTFTNGKAVSEMSDEELEQLLEQQIADEYIEDAEVIEDRPQSLPKTDIEDY